MVWVLNQQTRNPNRPSLKYSSGGSGPLWKWNEAFCLPTNGGGRSIYMRYFSMFSGIGGFELGIEKAWNGRDWEAGRRGVRPIGAESGDPICRRTGEGLLCVGFSEIDKYAIKIYKNHFKEHTNYGDATKIDPNTLPDFDLLVGGFPCQAFSIAGKRLGFEDTRGTLFFDIARILKVKRPRLLLLENVKGLLSHDNGRTFKTILSTLVELGYDVEWQVLNSKNHGVPQNRERVFIVGHLGGFGGREVFPIGEGGELSIQQGQKLSLPISNCLRTNYSTGFSNETYVHSENKLCDRRKLPQGNECGTIPKEETQTARIRRLAPTECERLQGYPDGWTAGVSDSQRYKTLGNSVTVNVIEAIISRLYG